MAVTRDSGPVVVVGLDGADFRYLDRFADELPALSGLRERGVEAPLRSTHPPATASAWPSVYTGLGPADHGVAGFFTYEGGDPRAARLVTREDVDAPALWNYCDAVGLGSAVLNVPVTHPADPVAGAVVPGYFAPPDASGHPAGIRERLSGAVEDPSGYRIYPADDRVGDGHDGGAAAGPGTPTPDLSAFLDLVDARRRAALELLDAVEWRLAFLQVQATDTVVHDLGDPDSIRAVYAAADRLVGAVLDHVPEDTGVVVCSDHGMGPADGYEAFVNERLRDCGLAAGSGEPSRRGPLGAATGTGLSDLVGAGLARAGRSLADAVGVTGRRVPRVAKRVGGLATGREAVEGVDWSASRAFCRVGSEMGVRVNLAGREPDGVVPPEEYEAVRSAVIDALSSWRTPRGDRVFEFVDRYEDRAGADLPVPPTGDLPDVAFSPRPGHTVSAKLPGRRLVPTEGHEHRREGVFLAAGGPFADADPPGTLPVTDVTPVVLASLGVAVPERTTGSVPPELLGGIERRRYDVDGPGGGRDTDGDGDGPSPAVRDRLDDLGYL